MAFLKQRLCSVALLLLAVLLGINLTGCADEKKQPPVTLTVWHYYNGVQQQTFSDLVSEFNETVGAKHGIFIESFGKGSIDDLRRSVLAGVENKVGAERQPDIFLSYADSAYELYKKGLLTDLSHYLTDSERKKYLSSYLTEGDFSQNGSLYLFPVAKSTEILMVNMTDFAPFAEACGINEQDLSTWEGISAIAEKFYHYTDSLTDTPNDGKAFFGRDALANYLLIGSLQLGEPIFKVEGHQMTLNVNRTVMRRLWDNFYVPYVSGHFAAVGRFRSDDAKTGEIIALVGATSGASYFPNTVTRPDASSYSIEARVFPLPNFFDCERYAVQQGAGMAVTKSDTRTEQAAAVFLKWLTEPSQNLRFCGNTGYLPVQKAAQDITLFNRHLAQQGSPVAPIVASSLEVGINMIHNYHFYTNQAFDNGYDLRSVVENFLKQQAEDDLAAVNALVDSGADRQTALAPFLTDAHFDQWLAAFENALRLAANKPSKIYSVS